MFYFVFWLHSCRTRLTSNVLILFLLAIIMGGRKTRTGAVLGSTIIVMLPKLLDDIAMFRMVSTALAVVVLIGAVIALGRRISTPKRVAIPVLGTAGLAIFSYWIDALTDWRLTIFGLMILLVVYYLQDGIVGFVRKVLSLGRVRVTKIDPADLRDAEADAVLAVRPEGNEIILDLRGILMQFSGLKALNDINLTVRRGTIHGLIGPNEPGARRMMMNVYWGSVTVLSAGSIEYDGQSIAGRTSANIALSGIARTFKNVEAVRRGDDAPSNVLVVLHWRRFSRILPTWA